MIVVGVDVHKQSLTAVAVDEVGRPLAELTVRSAEELLGLVGSLGEERLWALEDCRQLTRRLEQRAPGGGRAAGAGAAEADGAAARARPDPRQV